MKDKEEKAKSELQVKWNLVENMTDELRTLYTLLPQDIRVAAFLHMNLQTITLFTLGDPYLAKGAVQDLADQLRELIECSTTVQEAEQAFHDEVEGGDNED